MHIAALWLHGLFGLEYFQSIRIMSWIIEGQAVPWQNKCRAKIPMDYEHLAEYDLVLRYASTRSREKVYFSFYRF